MNATTGILTDETYSYDGLAVTIVDQGGVDRYMKGCRPDIKRDILAGTRVVVWGQPGCPCCCSPVTLAVRPASVAWDVEEDEADVQADLDRQLRYELTADMG